MDYNTNTLLENKRVIDQIADKINDMPCWMALMLFLAVVIITIWGIGFFYSRNVQNLEGFTQEANFILKQNDEVFEDPFYVGIYDDLFYKKIYNTYEVGVIVNEIHPTSKDVIIEIGSKTGNYVGAMKSNGYNIVGLDKSKAMVEYASKKYPDCKFIHGDPLEFMNFSSEYATAILLLDFSIYYISDRRTLFYNCYQWLKPGGYLVLHLVNRHMFDPVAPAAKPFTLVSPQSVAPARITNSDVVFNNFNYKSKFEIEGGSEGGEMNTNDTAKIIETMKDKQGKVRKNIRSMKMTGQKIIIGEAKDTGFMMLSQYDLLKNQREYQYIYILYKPSN
jgi:SAM-dependent methyltransferase